LQFGQRKYALARRLQDVHAKVNGRLLPGRMVEQAAIEIFGLAGNKLLTATLNVVFDDNVRELRAMYTSAVLPNGTALGTVITAQAKRLFPQSNSQKAADCRLAPWGAPHTPCNVLGLWRTTRQGKQGLVGASGSPR